MSRYNKILCLEPEAVIRIRGTQRQVRAAHVGATQVRQMGVKAAWN